MTGADFFLSVVAGVVSETILSRLRGRDSLAGVVRESLEHAVRAHEELLRKHTRTSDGTAPNPKPYVDRDAFNRMWISSLDCDPRDLASVVPYIREVLVLPGCPLAPDEHANLLTIALNTAKREFLAALPDHPRAKNEWDVACDVRVEDKLDTALDLLKQIEQRTASAEAFLDEETEPPGPILSLAKLPVTDPDLFGRDAELQILNDAWADPHTHIVALIAFGGIGKSAIVNEWLTQMAQDDYRGARRVFGWSFYSQGTSERTVSADQFIHSALTFFGDPDPNQGSPWDKGQRLAQLIRQQPTLLILDGLEPLQWGPGPQEGEFKDRAGSMYPLLRELSHGMDGLCLLSSRVTLTDIPLSDTPGPAHRIDLERLSTDTGRALLKHYKVKGLDAELDAAVEEYDGHALALCLLAEYLTEFLAGDIAKRDLVPPLPQETRQGRHAFRVMEAYDIALKREGREAERAILRIIGLFDRPASKDCLDALRREPPLEGITDSLIALSETDWRHALGRLRKWRLLNRSRSEDDGSLDTHPLVREYFGQKLEQESPKGFRQAHSRLYDHLRLTTDRFPTTLEEMEPLFQAVRHACCARRYDHVVDFVLDRRIHRGVGFSLYQLGAYGDELSALANFFRDPWHCLDPAIAADHQALLLNVVGFCLYALGRLTEAESLHSTALARAMNAQDWEPAAAGASNLVDVHIAVGNLSAAERSARAECEFAPRTRQSFFSLVAYAHRGTVYHLRGELAQARTEFLAAEQYAPVVYEGCPSICSVAGSRFDDYLLTCGKRTSVRERASRALALARKYGWLLDSGLALLDKARSRVPAMPRPRKGKPRATQGLPDTLARDLAQALASFRSSGHHEELVKGLIVAASLHRDFRERAQAERDLQEALDLSSRIGLRLHETDARLLQGHLALDSDPPDIGPAQQSLTRAQELVPETGYHVRDADLLILEGRLLAKQRNNEAGRAKLEEAITVARREEADGYVYRLALDQANRYLKEL